MPLEMKEEMKAYRNIKEVRSISNQEINLLNFIFLRFSQVYHSDSFRKFYFLIPFANFSTNTFDKNKDTYQ